MANVQVEDGHVRIANSLFEALLKLKIPGRHKDVAFAVIRFTYGYQRASDTIAVSQIAELTEIKAREVRRLLTDLVAWGIIGRQTRGNKRASVWWLVKDFDQWEPQKTCRPKHAKSPQRGHSPPGPQPLCEDDQHGGHSPVDEGPQPLLSKGPQPPLQRHKDSSKDRGALHRFLAIDFPGFEHRPEKFYQAMVEPIGNPLGVELQVEQAEDWHAWQWHVRGLNDCTARGQTKAIKTRWARLNKFEDELEAAAKWCGRIRRARRVAELRAASDALPDEPPDIGDLFDKINISTMGARS